jgi:membrane-bound lytic murein transglycosylase D
MMAWLAGPAFSEGADPRPSTVSTVSDSSKTPAVPTVQDVRDAYENAYMQRQAGTFAASIEVAESGLQMATRALESNPDQSTRLQITDLVARLTGLRDAAIGDRDAATAQRRAGNDVNEGVLNAPATGSIVPDATNPQVLKWVEFFTTGGRSTFERWLHRSGRYMEMFRKALQKEGLPPDLVHLVFVESGFNLNARSVSAAVGPWQFLRGTARMFGLTVNQWVDERKDPEKSTVAAARYLKHLYSMFGDWPLAIASYNAGEGTVMRAIQRQGTSNYWDLKLPRQTEEYVPQFMAVVEIMRDPEKYEFDGVVLDDPMEFDQVALTGPVDLRALARLADCTYEELKALNPAVLQHAANGSTGFTMVRVPHGKGEALMAKLREGEKLPAVDLTVRHKVRRGETLQKIANQYHVSATRLALANGIGRRHPLRRGTILTVPASLTTPAVAKLENDDPRASTGYVPAGGYTPRKVIVGQSISEGRVVHVVRKGETLAAIAQKYGVTVEDIRKWNRLTTKVVRRGTRLKIRTGEVPPAPVAADETKVKPEAAPLSLTAGPGGVDETPADEAKATDAKTPEANAAKATAKRGKSAQVARASKSGKPRTLMVTVKRGDTLSGIATRHGVSLAALKKANGLKSGRVLAGQKLKIPTS